MCLLPGCGELSGKIVRLLKCQYGLKQPGEGIAARISDNNTKARTNHQLFTLYSSRNEREPAVTLTNNKAHWQPYNTVGQVHLCPRSGIIS